MLASCGTLFFLVSACATRSFNAKKMFDAGLFNDASIVYEEILRDDPENVDAKIGLNSARSELWKQELVSIRLLRMSGNTDSALERAELLLKKTKNWDLSNFSSGDLISAQDEFRFAKRTLAQKISKLLNELKPLLAEDFSNLFPLIREVKVEGYSSSNSSEEIKRVGHQQCKALSEELKNSSFSSANFLKKYCSYFGFVHGRNMLAKNVDYRFSSIEVIGKIISSDDTLVTDEYRELVTTEVQRQLVNSPLFSSESPKVFLIKIAGGFSYRYQKEQVKKTHSYSVRVPFVAMEEYDEPYQQAYSAIEPYTENEPYSDTESVWNSCKSIIYGVGCSGGYDYRTVTKYRQQLKFRNVTRYRTLYQTKTRPVTRYRDEPRSYTYDAVDHFENAKLSVQLISTKDKKLSVSFSKEKENQFTTHNENLPDIGLSESSPKFLPRGEWRKNQYQEVSEQFLKMVMDHYASNYCESDSKLKDHINEFERASRCLEFSPENGAANSFFAFQFGYTIEKLNERLKQK
jgi:hypothetical protein